MRTVALLTLLALSACGGDEPTAPEVRAGGDTTLVNRTSQAFMNPAPNLTGEELEQHLAGDLGFEAKFVTAPAVVNPGLGPTFNSSSCNGCHIRNGRGMPAMGNGPLGTQLLVRVSDANGDELEGFGGQIQDHAVAGAEPEARVTLAWRTIEGEYADGTAYELREPVVDIDPLGGRELPEDAQISLRLPPPVFGLGLLEAVDEATIRALADPEDADGDGTSGRPNEVFEIAKGDTSLGRFGWKANSPTLVQQAAEAYFNDMGIESPLIGLEEEIDQKTLETTAFYTQTLAVPAPSTRQNERGRELFFEAGCETCHVSQLTTGNDHPIAALRKQTFAPYSDLLLHDMGEGLADHRPDHQANGREWRTAPLWGIGLTQTVLPYSTYLHDGRARTLAEAILWHGGEAEGARERFVVMSADERAALLGFLGGL